MDSWLKLLLSFGFDVNSLPYDFAIKMWIVDMHGKQKEQAS